MHLSSSHHVFLCAVALLSADVDGAARASETDERAVFGVVLDAAGKPVSGAAVYLAEGPLMLPRPNVPGGQALPRPDLIARTQSDEQGAFAIPLADETPESHWARTWLVLWVHRPGTALASYLVARDWPARAAPIEIHLAAPVSQSLVVVSPDEKPLPGARVMPERVDDLRLPAEVAARLAVTSDAAGLAVLGDLAPNRIDLVRLESADYGAQWAALPAASADGKSQIAMAPVGSVRGRLVADDRAAVAGRPVRLVAWLAADDDTAGGGFADAVTDAEGRFEAPAIAAGALTVTPDLRAELPLRCRPLAGKQVLAGKTTELTIPLELAVRVEGVVRDRDSGAPLAGAAVWLNLGAPPKHFPTADQQGRFRDFQLAGSVSPSPWRMPRGYYFPQVTLDAQPVPKDAEKVELKPLLLARGVALQGRVIDRRGHGVPGAEVIGRWGLPSLGEETVHAWSDRDGAFVLDGVDGNSHIQLSATSPQGATGKPVSVSPQDGKPVELTVTPAQALSLAGRVLDEAHKPVVDAAVRIAWQRRDMFGRPSDMGIASFRGAIRLLTDGEGRFQTPAELRQGTYYRAEIVAPGLLPATTKYVLPNTRKKATFGDIVLQRLPDVRTIAGRVVDRAGRPAKRVRVFQTGDGPRRTETTTNEQGDFRLSGLYVGPAILLVEGPSFPLQGFVVNGGESVELTARRADEAPRRQFASLPASLSRAERRELALQLIEPLLPVLKQPGLSAEKVQLLGALAAIAPERVKDYESLPTFAAVGMGEAVSYEAARTLVPEDDEEAFALGEALETPHYRGRLYLAACDNLSDAEGERKRELLGTALLHARAEPNAAQRTELIGMIGERWLDLGDAERGTALLREAEKLAEQLPAPSEAAAKAHDSRAHLRASFAGSLARVDTAAAIKLGSGFSGQFGDRCRMGIARGLARRDPAMAEKLIDELEFAEVRYHYFLPVLHALATADPDRAARLARSCGSDAERGYALGIVAHGLAKSDAARAAALLDEAYRLLEQAASQGAGSFSDDPAVLAAGLLPVAERIDPALVEGFFWRTLALRSPRGLRPSEKAGVKITPAALAIFISRYDRKIARALAAPIAAQIEALTASEQPLIPRIAWASLAVVDADWAQSLIGSLPDAANNSLRAAKNIGRRSVAEALAPSAAGWSHKFYQLVPGLRDPDARDDER